MLDPEDYPEDMPERMATATDIRLIMAVITMAIMATGLLYLLLA